MAYALNTRRAVAFLMISTRLVGCTADGLVPPAPIDRGTRVSAIPPGRVPVQQAPSMDAYAAPAQQPMGQVGSPYETAAQPMPANSIVLLLESLIGSRPSLLPYARCARSRTQLGS